MGILALAGQGSCFTDGRLPLLRAGRSHTISAAERASPAACGTFDPFAVRFSIGLEDAEDLISDAYVALDSLGLTGKH